MLLRIISLRNISNSWSEENPWHKEIRAQNPGKVFSKEQIYDIVWKEPCSGDYNIVMSHMRNIREKIEDDPSKPVYIQIVWGVDTDLIKNRFKNLLYG